MKKTLPHKKEVLEQFAIEGLIKGYKNSELVVLMKGLYPNDVTDEEVDSAIRAAHNAIREDVLTDIDKILPQHIELYEKLYKEFSTLGCLKGKLRALKQKEKLIGLLKENNTVEIYNEVNLTIEKDPEYNISKLTSKEQKRLGELMAIIES